MPPMQRDMEYTAADYVEFYREAYPSFPISHRYGGSIPLEMMRVEQGSHETRDIFADEIVVAVAAKSEIVHAAVDVGDGPNELRATAGGLYVAAPRGEALYSVDGPHTLLIAVLRERQVLDICGDDDLDISAPVCALHGKEAFDPLTSRHVTELWYELSENDAASNLLIDGMVQALLARLYRIGGAPPKPRAAARLDERQLARALELIDESISEASPRGGLTIERLAAELGVSQFYFSRAFKARTGMTPHQCLTLRRLDRARDLLEHSSASIAEIAYTCGFSSQAHMTSTFSKNVGVTPGRYRRSQRD